MQNINKFVIKINNVDVDLSNLPKALKMIKYRFFSEILLKQALAKFPKSLYFMLFKAQVSMDLINNKYLALTAITHINT